MDLHFATGEPMIGLQHHATGEPLDKMTLGQQLIPTLGQNIAKFSPTLVYQRCAIWAVTMKGHFFKDKDV